MAGLGDRMRLTDGSTSFEGGVDSGRVPTIAGPDNPTGLKRNQVAWLTNATVRGGGISQRTGWIQSTTDFDGDDGLFQGSAIYTPTAGVPYVIMSVAGRIFRVNVWTDGSVVEIGLPADPNPAAEEQSFFVQGEEFMLIQAGDYVTNPLIWDGTTMRRSLGYAPVADADKEIPPGRAMTYYKGHIWVQNNARTYMAGDIVYGPNGTNVAPTFYGFRDSILHLGENALMAGGGAFSVPDQNGAIRALSYPSTIDTALGQGQLIIYATDAIYSLDVPVDRTDWTAVTADVQPIQKVIQLRYGTTSERSIAQINGDLFYKSYDGVRSLAMAVRNYKQWGQVPLSRNENRVLQREDRTFARFASGIEFDNRYLVTVLPVATPVGTGHQGIIPLDFDVLGSMSDKEAPAWEGMQEGLDFLQILSAESGGLQRAFTPVHSRLTGKIEIWEMTNYLRNEGDDKRVNWVIEFPAYTWNNVFQLKELDSGEFWIDQINGTVDFLVQYRPDQDPCWVDWHPFRLCNARSSCEDIDPVCYPGSTVDYRAGYRATKALPKPQKRDDSNMIRPSNQGYQFQVRLLIKGYCRIRGIMLHALERARQPYQGINQ